MLILAAGVLGAFEDEERLSGTKIQLRWCKATQLVGNITITSGVCDCLFGERERERERERGRRGKAC